jgi:hypothetical protein
MRVIVSETSAALARAAAAVRARPSVTSVAHSGCDNSENDRGHPRRPGSESIPAARRFVQGEGRTGCSDRTLEIAHRDLPAGFCVVAEGRCSLSTCVNNRRLLSPVGNLTVVNANESVYEIFLFF